LAGSNVEFFTDAGAEGADEMIRVLSNQGGAVSGDFIGNPAAAGHEFSCQLPVFISRISAGDRERQRDKQR
jgi:hypothetical protein